MRFPLSLNVSLTKYLFKNKIEKNDKFPVVLMLEPTHICNLACDGCGRIREYSDTLDKMMSLSDCLSAIDECGAPVLSITGGEPLMYPEIGELVSEAIKRKKHIYLCTNALLLEESLHKFKPSSYLNFNVSLDGLEKTHDAISCRKGVFETAIKAIKAAKKAGFRICTNTSIYKETNMDEIEELFKLLTSIHIDGLLAAPAFGFEDVDDDIFMTRKEINAKFERIYEMRNKFRFFTTPMYLKFLRGKRDLECTPWGNPTRNIMGWKAPCYLITDAHYPTFKEMMEKTEWEKYGAGNDKRCNNCMMHCGFEATVVREVGKKFSDIVEMVVWNLT